MLMQTTILGIRYKGSRIFGRVPERACEGVHEVWEFSGFGVNGSRVFRV